MDHCFQQTNFVAIIRVALEMQQQASVSWFSVHLCFNLCTILDYFHTNKRDLVVNGKLHRKREIRVETVKSSKEICRSFSARHFGQGTINISSL